jgi:hypothetical protein
MITVGAGSFTLFGIENIQQMICNVFVTRPRRELNIDSLKVIVREMRKRDTCVTLRAGYRRSPNQFAYRLYVKL